MGSSTEHKSTNAPDASDDAVQHCVACGYSLRGLPEEGRCPECGNRYKLGEVLENHTRPICGWALLAVPPVVFAIGWLIGVLTYFRGGAGLMIFGPVATLFLSIALAHRVASWRYALALQTAADRSSVPSRVRYMLVVTTGLTLLQLAACVPTYLLHISLVPWLTAAGVLPRGWP